ncbi:variable surface protein [Plasmodium gonderi]|uniref:Variable surface protein n=1 Tax=Plasmodium gonderi TaxID=77519 RepID=A0A1Y1JMV2_PLAGO|nr:variable surface protein [Plasmodium gonderi]GAW83916.1 variable surface protein [Plasmodium gonderi]
MNKKLEYKNLYLKQEKLFFMHIHYNLFFFFQYYSWSDYIFFRDIFELNEESGNYDNEINIFLSSRSIDNNIRNKFIEYCNQIKEYFVQLENDNSCNSNDCCKYINYWINKKVREMNELDYKNPLNIFSYLKDYIHYNNHDNKYNMCVNDVIYLRDEYFIKMDKLYGVYDYYDELFNHVFLKINEKMLCNTFIKFVDEYNNFFETYIKSNYDFLRHELYSLRCLIKKYLLTHISGCSETSYELLKNFPTNTDETMCMGITESEYLPEYLRHKDSERMSTYYNDSNNIVPTIIIVLINIILGIIIFLFHKFGLINKFLHVTLKRNKKIWRKMNDEFDSYIMHKYENEPIYVKDNMYKISYISENSLDIDR